MVNWLQNHYQWVFSGIGVAVLTGVIAFFRKKSNQNNNEIKQVNIGNNGTQIGIQYGERGDRRD